MRLFQNNSGDVAIFFVLSSLERFLPVISSDLITFLQRYFLIPLAAYLPAKPTKQFMLYANPSYKAYPSLRISPAFLIQASEAIYLRLINFRSALCDFDNRMTLNDNLMTPFTTPVPLYSASSLRCRKRYVHRGEHLIPLPP